MTAQTLEWKEDGHRLVSDGFSSLFDALCCQVPEDIAICQLEDQRDWLAATKSGHCYLP